MQDERVLIWGFYFLCETGGDLGTAELRESRPRAFLCWCHLPQGCDVNTFPQAPNPRPRGAHLLRVTGSEVRECDCGWTLSFRRGGWMVIEGGPSTSERQLPGMGSRILVRGLQSLWGRARVGKGWVGERQREGECGPPCFMLCGSSGSCGWSRGSGLLASGGTRLRRTSPDTTRREWSENPPPPPPP